MRLILRFLHHYQLTDLCRTFCFSLFHDVIVFVQVSPHIKHSTHPPLHPLGTQFLTACCCYSCYPVTASFSDLRLCEQVQIGSACHTAIF